MTEAIDKVLSMIGGQDIDLIVATFNDLSSDKETTKKRKKFVDRLLNKINDKRYESDFKSMPQISAKLNNEQMEDPVSKIIMSMG